MHHFDAAHMTLTSRWSVGGLGLATTARHISLRKPSRTNLAHAGSAVRLQAFVESLISR
jgi:hypothetical protein